MVGLLCLNVFLLMVMVCYMYVPIVDIPLWVKAHSCGAALAKCVALDGDKAMVCYMYVPINDIPLGV